MRAGPWSAAWTRSTPPVPTCRRSWTTSRPASSCWTSGGGFFRRTRERPASCACPWLLAGALRWPRWRGWNPSARPCRPSSTIHVRTSAARPGSLATPSNSTRRNGFTAERDSPGRTRRRDARQGQAAGVRRHLRDRVGAARAGLGRGGQRLAHEIKNPLTPIQLSAERLEKKLAGKVAEPERLILAKSVHTIIDQVDAHEAAGQQIAATTQALSRRGPARAGVDMHAHERRTR